MDQTFDNHVIERHRCLGADAHFLYGLLHRLTLDPIEGLLWSTRRRCAPHCSHWLSRCEVQALIATCLVFWACYQPSQSKGELKRPVSVPSAYFSAHSWHPVRRVVGAASVWKTLSLYPAPSILQGHEALICNILNSSLHLPVRTWYPEEKEFGLQTMYNGERRRWWSTHASTTDKSSRTTNGLCAYAVFKYKSVR